MRDRFVTMVLSVAATYGLMRPAPGPTKELEVDRLIVRKELIVSDTGAAWEKGYEAHQIPRGLYARSLGDGPGGLWVRSRLIKAEVDDPFDDRFHAVERDGSLRKAARAHLLECLAGRCLASDGDHPGRGPGVERGVAGSVERADAPRPAPLSDVPTGSRRAVDRCAHRPGHDVHRRRRLRRRGLALSLGSPSALGWHDPASGDPDSGRPGCGQGRRLGAHQYAIIAVGAQGHRTKASPTSQSRGLATLRWDSVPAQTPI